MLHVVIMAGGSGTRFWPASRALRPKQLLPLVGGLSLLRATFRRVAPLVPPERIWVITTAATAEATRRLLPELDPGNVVAEPVGRDTAACAGFAAVVLRRRDPGAVCLLLPADHVIGDEGRFRDAARAAARHVASAGGLLTFGVRPTRPETGFGYLEVGRRVADIEGWAVHRLQRFVEKPDAATARGLVAEGRHLWNSGMFAWRVADLLGEIERQLPALATGLEDLDRALNGATAGPELDRRYPSLPRTSVDYGVMEGAEVCWTMPVDYPWSDVGSWPAAAGLLGTDDAGNAVRGRLVTVDAEDNVLVSEGPVIAAVGVRDLVIVATPDAVLVVPRDDAQRVKEAVQAIRGRGWEDVL